jgi:hypothetical protein
MQPSDGHSSDCGSRLVFTCRDNLRGRTVLLAVYYLVPTKSSGKIQTCRG